MNQSTHRYLRKERVASTQLTCRIPNDIFKKLEDKAVAHNVSLNHILNEALRLGLRRK